MGAGAGAGAVAVAVAVAVAGAGAGAGASPGESVLEQALGPLLELLRYGHGGGDEVAQPQQQEGQRQEEHVPGRLDKRISLDCISYYSILYSS